METTQLIFRAVRNGDKVIIGVYVESEHRWFEAVAELGQVVIIRDIFEEALAGKVA
jgi:hypothetical protein